jgi:hypothetical protein
MTRDDIIRMAREVGFVAYGEDAGEYRIPTPAFHSRLERFAALVAAAEREVCAKIVEECIGISRAGVVAAIRARGQA